MDMVDAHLADLSGALAERRAPAPDNLWAKFEGQFETPYGRSTPFASRSRGRNGGGDDGAEPF
jgi:hypothetical protein